MGWFTDLTDELGLDGATKALNENPVLGGILKTGLGVAALDQFSPDIPRIGYQGGIPNYEAVRSRVDRAPEQDPNRRPGEAGRRYFSDVVYAKGSDANRPTVAQATQMANDQVQNLASGGLANAVSGYYLGGATDGMADKVPATIDGNRPAALSDGEFVIPADVVSHLGNGNSDAGAKQLHGMMDSVRQARTGSKEQGKEINPAEFMPNNPMAQGGIAKYNTGGGVGTSSVGQPAGSESSLSSWAGPYVTDMLAKGKALSEQPYQAYQGPLSAGASNLQNQAMTSAGGLSMPTNMGISAFTQDKASEYMNPYLREVLDPQLAEARRQSEISRVDSMGRATKAGGFGGSRQAVMEAELDRGLQSNLANITGTAYSGAYNSARDQFNREQDARNRYGMDVIGTQERLGGIDRAIESEGMAADYAQFREERDFPLKQVQYQQSLLQGLPLEAQSVSYNAPSQAAQLSGAIKSMGSIYDEIMNT